MKCPECKARMTERTIRDISLDVCRKCGSLWFDFSELEAYFARDPQNKIRRSFEHSDFKHSTSGTEQTCPRCKSRSLTLGNFKGAGFRKCHSCEGISLDQRNQEYILDLHTRSAVGDFIGTTASVAESVALSSPEFAAAVVNAALEFIGELFSSV